MIKLNGNKVHGIKYPAGESRITIPIEATYPETKFGGVEIDFRFESNDDLIELMLCKSQLDHLGIPARLNILYFPYAREDKFSENKIHPCSLIPVTQFINNLNFTQVWILDPHSVALPCLLDRVNILQPHRFLHNSLLGFNEYECVIAPDAGAQHRAEKVADKLNKPCYTASKVRDPLTGTLTSYEIDLREKLQDGSKVLVVDDICDGGFTFLRLADTIKAQGVKVELDLYVSHGIFSRGIEAILDKYQRVITTNSICSIEQSDKLQIIDVNPYLI